MYVDHTIPGLSGEQIAYPSPVLDQAEINELLTQYVDEYVAATNQYSRYSYGLAALRRLLPQQQQHSSPLTRDVPFAPMGFEEAAMVRCLAAAKATLAIASASRNRARDRLLAAIQRMHDDVGGAWTEDT